MDHHRSRSIGQPGRRQHAAQRDNTAPAGLLTAFNTSKSNKGTRQRPALGKRAPPVNNHQMIRIDCIEHRRENCVAPVEPSPRQQKHRNSRRHQREPDINARGQRPREDRAQPRAQRPRGRRIKYKPRLAIGEVRQRRPSRINDPLLPLPQNFQPRIKMELDIVARRRAEKKEGNLHRKGGDANRQQGRPPKRVRSSPWFRTRRDCHCRCFPRIFLA